MILDLNNYLVKGMLIMEEIVWVNSDELDFDYLLKRTNQRFVIQLKLSVRWGCCKEKLSSTRSYLVF